jgi:hypothetical protein
MKTKLPGSKLTVVIRDDSPMVHCGDCPSYRTVVLSLTTQQQEALELRYSHTQNGNAFYESISHLILE